MGESAEAKIDFEWNDEHVLPKVINPEVAFLFRRMTEVTFRKINPRPGELILDVGCGKANDGVDITRKGAQVIGLEPSHVMIRQSREYIAENDSGMVIVHGVGENLPFRQGGFDKVYCKGSLDHFIDPSAAIAQMSRAVKPNGEVIIAIANFESLGFKLGRTICWLMEKLGLGKAEGKMVWDTPDDHTYRFHYANLRQMAGLYLEIRQITGVSLLFGLPWWGQFLSKLPGMISNGILGTLDLMARFNPRVSDVIILRGTPREDMALVSTS